MTIDLTGICLTIVTGIFGLLSLFVKQWLDKKQASETLGAAVRNSLGALQQAATETIIATHPSVFIPGVPAELQVPVRYVLDHAGTEMKTLNIVAPMIAEKVAAQIGLAQIAQNLAVAGSASPVVPDPLGPVPVVKSVV